jgi:hypothetical protein
MTGLAGVGTARTVEGLVGVNAVKDASDPRLDKKLVFDKAEAAAI